MDTQLKDVLNVEMMFLAESIDMNYYLKDSNDKKTVFNTFKAVEDLTTLLTHKVMSNPGVDKYAKIAYITKAIDCFANHLNISTLIDYSFSLTLRGIRISIPKEVFQGYLLKLYDRNTYTYSRYIKAKEMIEKEYRPGSLFTIMINASKDRMSTVPTFIITDRRKLYKLDNDKEIALEELGNTLLTEFDKEAVISSQLTKVVIIKGVSNNGTHTEEVFGLLKYIFEYDIRKRFYMELIDSVMVEVKSDNRILMRFYNDNNDNLFTVELEINPKHSLISRCNDFIQDNILDKIEEAIH